MGGEGKALLGFTFQAAEAAPRKGRRHRNSLEWHLSCLGCIFASEAFPGNVVRNPESLLEFKSDWQNQQMERAGDGEVGKKRQGKQSSSDFHFEQFDLGSAMRQNVLLAKPCGEPLS